MTGNILLLGILISLLPDRLPGEALENARLKLGVPQEASESFTLHNKATGHDLALTATAPRFEFKEGEIGGATVKPDKMTIQRVAAGREIALVYPEQMVGKVGVVTTTHFFVPDDGAFIRKYATLTFQAPSAGSLSLLKVTLLDEPVADKLEFSSGSPDSQPVFTSEYFFGVEVPAASAREQGHRVVLSHMPGKILDLSASYRSRVAIIGVSRPGRTKEDFQAYIESLRPKSRFHVNYCSWWTSSMPYSEDEILNIMKELDEHFNRTNKVSLDSFTIDLGWSATRAIWQINGQKFPHLFAPLKTAAAKMNMRLGIWWSPSNEYSPMSSDNEWARAAGYETFVVPWAAGTQRRMACLAKGGHYQWETKAALTSLARDYHLGQFKCDGYYPECPESEHGHMPGLLSREVVAEGLIDILESLREIAPDAWFNMCQRTAGSPWWLRFTSSIVGFRGNDAPFGAVPAPVYRESYTTSRDFFNMFSARSVAPLEAEDLVVDVVQQSDDPLYNDAVVALSRGHQFFSLYLNPRFMKPEGYRFLSELITWARANQELLGHTHIILPQTWQEHGMPQDRKDVTRMARQTYGYAHWSRNEGLVCLRNPWIATDVMNLKLDAATLGNSDSFSEYAAFQIYPYPACLATGLKSDDTLKIVMGPYQTRLIRLIKDPGFTATEDPMTKTAAGAGVSSAQSHLLEVAYDDQNIQRLASNTTVLSPPKGFQWISTIAGHCDSNSSKLYYLIESPEQVVPTRAEFSINNRPVSPVIMDSKQGWAAAQPGEEQTHWKWYLIDLPDGAWDASATIELSHSNAQVSAWVLTNGRADMIPTKFKPWSGNPPFPTHPDYEAQTSLIALASTSLLDLPTKQGSRPAQIQTVSGVFLDALNPSSVEQGWGQLQKNQSVGKTPLVIGPRNFLRGIGTISNSRITYNLDGRYKTFHGFAGANSRTRGGVTFEFWVDDELRWKSKVLEAGAVGTEFHVPVTNAKKLVVVVNGVGKKENQGTHADLAEAWLEE